MILCSIIFRFICRYDHLLKKSLAPQSCFKLFCSLPALFSEPNTNGDDSVTPVDTQLRSLCKKSPFPYAEAVSLFERSATLPTESACNILVKTLANSGNIEHAFSIINRMLNAKISLQLMSLNILIEYFICIYDKKLVMCVVGIILKRGYTGSTTLMYNILKYLCLNRDAACACEFFHGMRTFFEPLDVGVYKTLIVELSQAKKLDEAKDLMGALRASDCCPSIDIYDSLIEAFCEHVTLDEAMSFLEEMGREGFPADSFLYFRLLLRCQIRDIYIGREIFRKMMKEGSSLNMNHYNHLVFLLCKSGMWNEVTGMLRSMVETGIEPDSFTYLCMIYGLCKESKPKKAIDILNLELRKGVLPDAETFTILIDTCCKEGLVVDACNILKVMLGKDVKPNVAIYNTLLIEFCKIGNLEKAMKLFGSLVNRGSHVKPNAVTINTIINALCKKGGLWEATKVFDGMIARMIVMDSAVYTTLIWENLKVQSVENALYIWTQMLRFQFVPNYDVFSAMIHGFCNVRMINIAQGFFMKMRAYGFCPRLVDYNILMLTLCKVRCLQGAKRVFQELKIAGYEPDSNSYLILIRILLLGRDFQTIYALFTEMTQRGFTPDAGAYHAIIKGFLISGDIKKAVFVFDKMIEFGFIPDILVYNSLLRGFFLARERGEIMRLLHQMAARRVVLNSKTYITIMGCLCHISDDLYILYNSVEIFSKRGYGEPISCDWLMERVSRYLPSF